MPVHGREAIWVGNGSSIEKLFPQWKVLIETKQFPATLGGNLSMLRVFVACGA